MDNKKKWELLFNAYAKRASEDSEIFELVQGKRGTSSYSFAIRFPKLYKKLKDDGKVIEVYGNGNDNK